MNQQRSRVTLVGIASLCLVLASATVAEAHSVNKQFGDFYGGLLHPLTALEHLVPFLGLGLLAGQQGTSSARWVLLLFPIGLFVGATAAGNLEPNSLVEWLNRLSFVAIGALVACAVRVPLPALAISAVVLGFSHGYENTADVSAAVVMHLFISGVVVTGIAMIAIFAALTVTRQVAWQKIAVRVIGSWITAIGILIIGLP
jgi:urease accessory protein